jgi:hypothetical protein
VLQLFTLDRTLLFMGCADTIKDPNFSRLVEWASEALKDLTHCHFLAANSAQAHPATGCTRTPAAHATESDAALGALPSLLGTQAAHS